MRLCACVYVCVYVCTIRIRFRCMICVAFVSCVCVSVCVCMLMHVLQTIFPWRLYRILTHFLTKERDGRRTLEELRLKSKEMKLVGAAARCVCVYWCVCGCVCSLILYTFTAGVHTYIHTHTHTHARRCVHACRYISSKEHRNIHTYMVETSIHNQLQWFFFCFFFLLSYFIL